MRPIEYPLRDIGKAIRATRKQSGMGLREFAQYCKVDHTLVLRVEKGKDISADSLLKIASTYGIKIVTP